MKVPPSMMNPAGKIAFTPHIERYFPTRGPGKKEEEWKKEDKEERRNIGKRTKMMQLRGCPFIM